MLLSVSSWIPALVCIKAIAATSTADAVVSITLKDACSEIPA